MAADTLASRLYNRRKLPKVSDMNDIKTPDDGSFVAKVSADLTEASQDRIDYEIQAKKDTREGAFFYQLAPKINYLIILISWNSFIIL